MQERLLEEGGRERERESPVEQLLVALKRLKREGRRHLPLQSLLQGLQQRLEELQQQLVEQHRIVPLKRQGRSSRGCLRRPRPRPRVLKHTHMREHTHTRGVLVGSIRRIRPSRLGICASRREIKCEGGRKGASERARKGERKEQGLVSSRCKSKMERAAMSS